MKCYWKREVNISVVVIYIVPLSVLERDLGKKTQNNKAENCAEKTKERIHEMEKKVFRIEV